MSKYLPVIIILVVGSFALGSFFSINVSVDRRPLLQRLLTLGQSPTVSPSPAVVDVAALQSAVLPTGGIDLPIKWGDLGVQLVRLGVIDRTKFDQIYANVGGLKENAQLLDSSVSSPVKITAQNSGIILNLLWALGLANQNDILTSGPMMDKQYGGAGNFASTGGWNLSKTSAMNYYAKYKLVTLTAPQQELVSKVAQNIYRPCCGNSTYFPDCNHGMAMLALLELMAANDVSEAEMYKVALQVNAYWFPDTYLTIAKYKAGQGIPWDKVDPKEVLGNNYSSSMGYQRIAAQVEPIQQSGGGSCGS